MYKFTVITVCLNAEEYIEKTLKSVLEQRCTDYEYIIQDGGSCDRTNFIIEQYIPLFREKGIVLKHYIEKDNGIYDAMNKAVQAATGKWIIFMNAGDLFFDCHVLNDVLVKENFSIADIIYGHTMIELTRKKYKFIAVHDERLLDEGMSMGHQAMFVKRDILIQFQFDCSYEIAADYELCLHLAKSNMRFERLNLIVARYSREGISSRKGGVLKKECSDVRMRYGLQDKKASVFLCKVLSLITGAFPFLSDIKYCVNQMKRMGITFKEDM